MTQLFIDNQEVALPEDFTFELIRENPFFTKGGSFTLDISLNLDIPVNARLYCHLNRFTASSKFKNRSARLIVDGRTVLNGTEIILEVNELSASIQLASGNSELNFLVGSDVKMNSLNLGSIPVFSSQEAYMNRFSSYPETNFTCSPIKAMNGNDPIFINNLKDHCIHYFEGKFNLYSNEKFPEEIRPLPYLNFIIERCITELGYTIAHNSIRESNYNYLFVVHGNNPKQVNELMPDKTVAEFLSEVEELFNVLIQVNEDKTVNIIFAYEFYENPTIFTPKKVTEQFERKYLNPDEQPAAHTSSNIRFDFDDTDFSKESDIDPDVRSSLNEVKCKNLITLHEALKKMSFDAIMRSIFVDQETGQEFIAKSEEDNSSYKLWPVNTFKRIAGKSGSDIEIEIVPADIEVLKVDVGISAGWYYYTGYIQIPVAPSFVGTTEEKITAEEAIQGKTKTSQKLNKITVAFAIPGGYYVFPIGEETTTKPVLSYHTTYPTITTHYNAPWVTSQYYPLDEYFHATLSFKSEEYGLYDQIYSKAPAIETEEETTMHAILDGIIPQATDIFIVNNKKFVCKDVHFKITPDGFDSEYQATLYPMQ